MQHGRPWLTFLPLVAFVAVFVWLTGKSLPDPVASHFGASGAANGFMPRAFYVKFMLGFVVGVPLLLVVVPGFSLGRSATRINLPNREYWLAPERRAETILFLQTHFVRLASMLAAFLCYVHWLVVRANALQPPRLSSPWFISGLVVLVAATLFWATALLARFRNRP